jgi:hypothetical protein
MRKNGILIKKKIQLLNSHSSLNKYIDNFAAAVLKKCICNEFGV